ncbi:hypothetical protein [Terriglobus sp.]|uniref:hypothetical protein n=1 Tax=Terriglobus sp. TaxID=1889013 RepID=UPI003AFFBD5F
MGIVVVGGHTRNIGKTTVVEQILRATADLRWTAMKITQFGHGVCSANGEPCDCDTGDHTVAISEERSRDRGTDTSRMLAAGSERVLWVRTRQGQLAEAMPRIRRELASATNMLFESNSVLRFLKPDLYLAVLDEAVVDFKPSALRYLDRADIVLTADGRLPRPEAWPGVSAALLHNKPVYALGHALPAQIEQAVRTKCAGMT